MQGSIGHTTVKEEVYVLSAVSRVHEFDQARVTRHWTSRVSGGRLEDIDNARWLNPDEGMPHD